MTAPRWVRTGAESAPLPERAGAAQPEAAVRRDTVGAESAEQFAGADRVLTPFILSSISGAI